jgi:hypothetical protein
VLIDNQQDALAGGYRLRNVNLQLAETGLEVLEERADRSAAVKLAPTRDSRPPTIT